MIADERPKLSVPATIADIWERLLGSRPEPGSSFFEMGGSSLTAVRLLARIRRELGVELTLTEIITHPQLAAMATLVETRGAVADAPAEPAPVIAAAGRHPVNANQAARLMRARRALAAGGGGWNTTTSVIAAGYRIEGDLDPAALSAAVAAVARRHDGLRAAFSLDDLTQWVVPAAAVELEIVEADGPPLVELATLPFDLGSGVLARFLLRRTGPREHEFWFGVEHLVADRLAVRILLEEISQVYRACVTGGPLPELSEPLQNQAVGHLEEQFCASAAGRRAYDWWARSAGGGPLWRELKYPGSRQPIGDEWEHGVTHQVEVDAGTVATLAANAGQDGATWLLVSLAALTVAVAERTGADRVPVLVPIGNRQLPGTESVVSFLTTNLALEVPALREAEPPDVLKQVRELLVDALTHGAYPAQRLIRELTPQDWGHPRRHPVLYLDLDSTVACDLELAGCTVGDLPEPGGAVGWGIWIWMRAAAEGMRFELRHPRGYLPPQESAELAQAVLRGIVRFADALN
ncbi:Phosphopantetheine attachment site [Micromonospora haikouensis]|uniref:Phosphopantetheine attachment site n=1 Tax=Micromonospora haikouensis TaxID=686309 RepID=A0A1C4XE04_9ACTN|nr:condensation domain-containing protein [Micromonospora haikouensis]SCF06637.1 Phosphopantetheine attachment site [Micromonospora haikouensis]